MQETYQITNVDPLLKAKKNYPLSKVGEKTKKEILSQLKELDARSGVDLFFDYEHLEGIEELYKYSYEIYLTDTDIVPETFRAIDKYNDAGGGILVSVPDTFARMAKALAYEI